MKKKNKNKKEKERRKKKKKEEKSKKQKEKRKAPEVLTEGCSPMTYTAATVRGFALAKARHAPRTVTSSVCTARGKMRTVLLNGRSSVPQW